MALARSRSRLHSWLRSHPLTTFLLVTFAWSWGWDALVYLLVGPGGGPWFVPGIPRTWGPLVGGLVATRLAGDAPRAWLARVADPRVGARWYLLALLAPLALNDLSTGIALASGRSVLGTDAPLSAYLLKAVYVFALAGGLEEFGWRGFAQPRLQRRLPALDAAVLVGLIWAGWHLPLFVLFDFEAYRLDFGFLASYLGFVVALSVLFAWLTARAGGSVLPAMVFHAVHNNPGLFEAATEPTGLLAVGMRYGSLVAEVLAVVAVVSFAGRSLGVDRTDWTPTAEAGRQRSDG